MTGGHQVVGLRKRRRVVPEWTRNNKAVRGVLLRSFPKLMTDAKQRARAACWARIIHLYFRMQWTYNQVAEELETKPGNVARKIISIKRVAGGFCADNGKDRLGVKFRGRPRVGKSS